MSSPSTDDQKRELAEALGKVPSLTTWDDLIQAVRDLRNEVDILTNDLELERTQW